jgi:hypothetical protein
VGFARIETPGFKAVGQIRIEQLGLDLSGTARDSRCNGARKLACKRVFSPVWEEMAGLRVTTTKADAAMFSARRPLRNINADRIYFTFQAKSPGLAAGYRV